MQFCSLRCSGATAWCDHYDAVQTCAVVLLYLQVYSTYVGLVVLAYLIVFMVCGIEHRAINSSNRNRHSTCGLPSTLFAGNMNEHPLR